MRKYAIYQGLTGADFILRENEDGSISSFATDLANPDYQAYLNKDKAEQSTPMVTDEASTL
jgi:hypothetical protein